MFQDGTIIFVPQDEYVLHDSEEDNDAAATANEAAAAPTDNNGDVTMSA